MSKEHDGKMNARVDKLNSTMKKAVTVALTIGREVDKTEEVLKQGKLDEVKKQLGEVRYQLGYLNEVLS